MNRSKKLKNIKNGMVIDHIPGGWGLTILVILGIRGGTKEKISVITNVESKRMGKKDIVKLENIKVNPIQFNVIAVVAPKATVNIIDSYKVLDKHNVELLDEIKGMFDCLNPTCVSHTNPVAGKFLLTQKSQKIILEKLNHKKPLLLKCYYCEKEWPVNELIESMEIVKSKELFEFVKNRVRIKREG